MKNLTIIAGFLFLLAFTVGFSGCAGMSNVKPDRSPAASSGSAGIDGRWTGEVDVEGFGTILLGFNLKAEGNTLTGTSDGQDGPIAIANGKINGNKISFDVTVVYNGQDIVIYYTGVLSGDELRLSWPAQGGVIKEATCTRQ